MPPALMPPTSFIQRLHTTITRSNSVLIAGIDPVLEDLPQFAIVQAQKESNHPFDIASKAIVYAYTPALHALKDSVAAVKLNAAFFEQFGPQGLACFATLTKSAQDLGIPVIADSKRGDIGNTARAYSAAFIGKVAVFGQELSVFDVDALTVNPYLGFDTVEEFVTDAERYQKGIFVLVKTSNPGSSALQGVTEKNRSVSDHVALWLGEQASRLQFDSPISTLGAVVGATYPAQARELRALMPNNLFLIPGLGAQGGTASDAVQGFRPSASNLFECASLINVSRGLFQNKGNPKISLQEYTDMLLKRANEFNTAISQAYSERTK